uniref:Uncharacterized protein n=1 Tax=Rhizophora mucronata TaxID=61149 RepID=A0A2P2NSA6_RHIMU
MGDRRRKCRGHFELGSSFSFFGFSEVS